MVFKVSMLSLMVLLLLANTFAHDCGSSCASNVYNYYGNDAAVDNQDNLIIGPTGKPGKMGAKGEPGVIGMKGNKGNTGADGNCHCHCDLSELAQVTAQLAEIKEQLKVLKCGMNGLLHDDICYFILNDKPIHSSAEAQELCESKGATLARVKSRGAYQKIKTYVHRFKSGSQIDVWLGGTYQSNSDRVINWSDGTTGTIDFWFPNYPRTTNGHTALLYEDSSKQGIWNYSPNYNRDFVFPLCQYE